MVIYEDQSLYEYLLIAQFKNYGISLNTYSCYNIIYTYGNHAETKSIYEQITEWNFFLQFPNLFYFITAYGWKPHWCLTCNEWQCK